MRKKKIIVLTGSPRIKGNTFALTERFVETLKEYDCDVIRFDAVSLRVGSCHACETCFRNGMPCSFDDDFNMVARELLEADGILFSFPVYFGSVPAKLKAVIDKFYCFYKTGKCKYKEWGWICCCDYPDPRIMDGARVVLEDAARLFQWHFVGELLVPGVGPAGAVLETNAMDQAAAFAKAFVNPSVWKR